MPRMTYKQAFEDRMTLWAISPAYDMTGGYVDSDDMEALLASPNKVTAKACLFRQISYWFQSGTEDHINVPYKTLLEEFPVIGEIHERHIITYHW